MRDNYYTQSRTINVAYMHGRKSLKDAYKDGVGTIQAVSHKEEHIVEIAMSLSSNRQIYFLSRFLLSIGVMVVFAILFLRCYDIILTIIGGCGIGFGVLAYWKIDKDMFNYRVDIFGYYDQNYLPYSVIIKRKDLINKNKK